MHLTAIAIDDEPAALRTIEKYAAEVPFLKLMGTFTASMEALSILQTTPIDLVFLDVVMPGRTGIQFKEAYIKEQMVIFTTAYDKYAKVGFDLDIVDFLEKPYSFDRFDKACFKAMDHKVLRLNRFSTKDITATPAEPTFILIKTGGQMEEKVTLKDILYIEGKKNNYPEITLIGGKKLVTRITLTDLHAMLPSNLFARVNRSYLVALDKVEKLGAGELVIAGKTIPFGGAYEAAEMAVRDGFGKR